MASFRIALAQINPTVGDLEGNLLMIEDSIREAARVGAHIVAVPELAVPGYPPEDLALKPGFIDDNLRTIEKLKSSVEDVVAVVGFLNRRGKAVYNAAAIISRGEVLGVYHKHELPNYGVFDEKRYWQPGEGLLLGKIGELVFGVTVCEDLWFPDGPHAGCAAAGAQLIININSSPYHRGKGVERLALLQQRARDNNAAFAYVNNFGGQDELIFDGQSMVVDHQGNLLARAKQFETELLVFDLTPTPQTVRGSSSAGANEAVQIVNLGDLKDRYKPQIVANIANEYDSVGEVYSALVLGVRDYLRKNGFDEAIVGLSGGIDSALTATIAADALGPVNVHGVLNPSIFTSEQSNVDAEKLARTLGIQVLTLPINTVYESALKTMDPVFQGTEWNVAEENLQSRIRGMIWMAISNKSEGQSRRKLVLSTGNKSEMAVGYATLYGDMAGGFAVLKDVPKTLVYELARWRNLSREVIPPAILQRAPSAELRKDQLDTDSLPEYDVLDPILQAYVEEDRSAEDIQAMGFEPQTVRKIIELVDRAEYKRRQAPPGIKITERAFGRDRRLPITNAYHPYRRDSRKRQGPQS